MTRTFSICKALKWSQPKLAEWIGCDQSTVSRLVNGQPETGPQSKLLDILQAEIIDGKHGDEARRRLSRPVSVEAAE